MKKTTRWKDKAVEDDEEEKKRGETDGM